MEQSKILKPFVLLYKAFRNCWDEIWKSVLVMAVITIILATVFYLVESPLQDEYGNWFQNLIWAFCVYIGDPGGIGGAGPVTTTGKIIATILGFLNILIVAVPAGIIAGGFTTTLEEDTRQKKCIVDYARIKRLFKPAQNRATMLWVMPLYKSVVSLQVRCAMPEEDVINAINYSDVDDLRLRNLADSYPIDYEPTPADKLIVELFPAVSAELVDGSLRPIPAKDYGCLINRRSNVTVVCTSSYKPDEIGDSRFGYLLAEMGGFNFMSREFDESEISYLNLPAGVSYDSATGKWNDPDGKLSPGYLQFFDDLKSLASGPDKWVIMICMFPRKLRSQFFFVSQTNQKDICESTITEAHESDFLKAYEEFRKLLEAGGDKASGGYAVSSAEIDNDRANPLHCELNTEYLSLAKRNLGVVLGAGVNCNSFQLRCASKFLVRDRRLISISLEMARIMRRNFVGDDSYIADHIDMWKKDGIIYFDAQPTV